MSRSKYKPVAFPNHRPLEAFYNDGTGHLYSVAKLVEMTKDLIPFDAPLQAISLASQIWSECNMHDLAYHVMAVNNADLECPIILDWHGEVADGRHRIIKALTLGHSTIKCVRMHWKPDYDKVIEL